MCYDVENKNLMKKYFFLAGLPRSGNTLFSAILNQNPDVMVSANSFLNAQLYYTNNFKYSEHYFNFPDSRSLDNLISSTFDSYYKDWDAKYIIDRGPWGVPFNLKLLKEYLNNEIKIVVTVRDIVQIIASYIKTSPEYLRKRLEHQVDTGARFEDLYKPEVQRFCELITEPAGHLDHFLFSLGTLCQEENRKYLHIVEYKDLVNDPKKTIRKVYDFLDIPRFDHNFKEIQDFNVVGLKYNDKNVFNSNMHEVKSSIQRPNYKLRDILPQYLIDRYSNREFWR